MDRQQRHSSVASTKRGAQSDSKFVSFCTFVALHQVTEVVTTVATIYALFGNDLKLWATSVTADLPFDIVAILCLVIFTLEIFVSCVGKENYTWHTFFWFDLISTGTLILDLSWIYYEMYLVVEENAEMASSDVMQVSRAGKAGSQVARVLRVMRLVRLIRVAKLYKTLALRFQPKEEVTYQQDLFLEPGERAPDDVGLEEEAEVVDDGDEYDSKIGRELTDRTTRKVIYIILVMTIVLPFLSEDQYLSKTSSEQSGLDSVAESATAAKRYNTAPWWRMYSMNTVYYINYHRKHGIGYVEGEINPQNLVYMELPLPLTHVTESAGRVFVDMACLGFKSCDHPLELPPQSAEELLLASAVNGTMLTDELESIDSLRPSEREIFSSAFCEGPSEEVAGPLETQKASSCVSQNISIFKAVYDKRELSHLECALSMLKTVFVCLIMVIGTVAINHDINTLILRPIERMITKMNKIRNNPLAATNMNAEGEDRQSEESADGAKGDPLQAIKTWMGGKSSKTQKENYETAILEKTIIKIGGLLALGFGEAGAEIIAKNMHTADGNINAMIEGRKMEAIFGFCDIRNFTDATEILKEKVMVFVNQIAEIVHGTVDQFSGSANKNIGDAFLLVWKFPEREIADGIKEQIIDTVTSNKLADMAVMSFVKVVAGINKSHTLAEYREIPEIIERMGTGWKVKMGFGLHVGWAIEGAIGSEYKIDASYLSPNVNMASRLEAATKQYGVTILISSDLYDIMSPQTQTYCRQIDRATVKGSKVPLGLYTVDLDPGRLQVPSRAPVTVASKHTASLQRQQRLRDKNRLWSSRTSISAMFETDPDIVSMREHLTKEFLGTFRSGFRHYEAGEWYTAREIFVRTQYMLGVEDGPSTVLLHFMSTKNYVAPEDWGGFRELIEK
ncbi:adenylyl cyclase, putative [Eimeria mitis]|uniref:Adenylyl cyclase, putative n=1 Tax=Eimeria mitis TaxID=44415 RepID=U6KDB7_9EIME|nr:adenylyl cyclase, putative [Eimeria mitis]CDJ35924.1 adenylyl cyclase, putative [Eimeria mitis]